MATKKIVSLFLALLMALGLCVTAGAEEAKDGEGEGSSVDGEAATDTVGDEGAGSASVCPPRGIISAIRATTAMAAARTMSRGKRDRVGCGSVVTHPAYAVARPGRND